MSYFLVFGANGQLGNELLDIAKRENYDLISLDRSAADITNEAAIVSAIAEYQPRVVINAAAYTAVDRAETEFELAMRVNGIAPGQIAFHCAKADIPFVHISTDYVFDGTKIGAYTETDPIAPLGAYGRSKAAGEEAIRGFHSGHIIIRTSWVYSSFGSNFLKTIMRLACDRARLTVVADQYGCPTAASDLASGILIAAHRAAEGTARWGTYHLAGTGVTTWHGFASEIIRCIDGRIGCGAVVSPITTADFPTQARRPANSELSSEVFVKEFGYRPPDWQSRVAEVVDLLLKRSNN